MKRGEWEQFVKSGTNLCATTNNKAVVMMCPSFGEEAEMDRCWSCSSQEWRIILVRRRVEVMSLTLELKIWERRQVEVDRGSRS